MQRGQLANGSDIIKDFSFFFDPGRVFVGSKEEKKRVIVCFVPFDVGGHDNMTFCFPPAMSNLVYLLRIISLCRTLTSVDSMDLSSALFRFAFVGVRIDRCPSSPFLLLQMEEEESLEKGEKRMKERKEEKSCCRVRMDECGFIIGSDMRVRRCNAIRQGRRRRPLLCPLERNGSWAVL